MKTSVKIAIASGLIIAICGFSGIHYLASQGVILRSQKLVLVKDQTFTQSCIREYEKRASEADKNRKSLFGLDSWHRNPRTVVTVSKDQSLEDLIMELRSSGAEKPWKIIINPGMREEIVSLEDQLILFGVDSDSSGLKSDGKDFSASGDCLGRVPNPHHHNILCYVPENASCHLENLSLHNTLSDYPSQAMEVSENARVSLINCHLLSHGNDTLVLRSGAYVAAFGCSIRGNSDCISSHSNADFWNCYVDSRYRGDGTRALWLGSISHLYLEGCILRSVNGAIEFSNVKRPSSGNQVFLQQVTLVDCVLTRKAHHGRFFSVKGPLDGLLYRYDTQPPSIVHSKDTISLEKEMGASGTDQYLHKVTEQKVYKAK